MAKVRITTSMGEIVVRLYDETPQHRDNFLKLASEGYYEGTLFHRVIKDFMIQGGDPESKGAPGGKMLGSGGPGYTLPAEIDATRFIHKRGALSAARLGDEVNPQKESSGSQFYIVWGKTYRAAELRQIEKQREMQQVQQCFQALAAERRADIMNLRRTRDQAGLMELQEQLADMARRQCKENGGCRFTEEQAEIYTTLGGTPFLDGDYTVFGEVEMGLDVVEQIQNTPTQRGDRPKEDVRIIKTIVE